MKKLYVTVRTDLSGSQQAVQAGHALAEYMKTYDDWHNGTLVYLGASIRTLENLAFKLKDKGIPHAKFHEPDIGDELTALANATPGPFKKLSLLCL